MFYACPIGELCLIVSSYLPSKSAWGWLATDRRAGVPLGRMHWLELNIVPRNY